VETTTQHYAAIWSICVLYGSAVTMCMVDSECILHNSIVLAICMPKIIKLGGGLTKLWQKQVGAFLDHPVFVVFRVHCTNVIHDLGSAEPRSRVEPSSRWIMLHRLELGSADPIQLNGRGYNVDDADWSSRTQPVSQLQSSTAWQ